MFSQKSKTYSLTYFKYCYNTILYCTYGIQIIFETSDKWKWIPQNVYNVSQCALFPSHNYKLPTYIWIKGCVNVTGGRQVHRWRAQKTGQWSAVTRTGTLLSVTAVSLTDLTATSWTIHEPAASIWSVLKNTLPQKKIPAVLQSR